MEALGNVTTSLILIGLITVGIISIGITRRSSGQHTRSSDSLWGELRRAHRLSWGETWRLRSAAEAAGLEPEALIFVEPHVLQQAIDAVGRESSSGKRLERLADTLYG